MFGFRGGGRRRPIDLDGAQAGRPPNPGAGRYADRRDAVAAGAPDAPPHSNGHEAAGKAQEEIRGQLAELGQRLQAIGTVGDALQTLQRSVSHLLVEHQRTQISVDGARGELEAERESHARLRHEFSVLQEASQGQRQAFVQLEIAMESLQQRFQDVNAELTQARQEQAAAQGEIARLRSELAELQSRADEAEERAALYRGKFEERQIDVAALENAVKKHEQQAAMVMEEFAALQISVEQRNRDLARRERELAETLQQLEQTEAARVELDAQLAETMRKHKAAEQSQAEALEQARAMVGSLTNRSDALSSRLQVTEQLLARAREEITLRTEEHGTAQRQILQLNLERSALEKRVEELRRERERVDRLARETSEINTRLAERSHALVATLKARDRDFEATRQKLVAATAELAHVQEQARATEEQFQTHVAELNAQLAHERSSRQMSDGSLEAARATIDGLRAQLARVRAGGGDAGGGADHPGAPAARLPAAAQLVLPDDAQPDEPARPGAGAGAASRMPQRHSSSVVPNVIVEAEDPTVN